MQTLRRSEARDAAEYVLVSVLQGVRRVASQREAQRAVREEAQAAAHHMASYLRSHGNVGFAKEEYDWQVDKIVSAERLSKALGHWHERHPGRLSVETRQKPRAYETEPPTYVCTARARNPHPRFPYYCWLRMCKRKLYRLPLEKEKKNLFTISFYYVILFNSI